MEKLEIRTNQKTALDSAHNLAKEIFGTFAVVTLAEDHLLFIPVKHVVVYGRAKIVNC